MNAVTTDTGEALDRISILHTLWLEQRRIAHRARLARLRFEHLLDGDLIDAVEEELDQHRDLVRAFAASRGRST
jgi:hypothetical protein